VTGTLTYKESHQLSGHAYAIVVLVSGSARATESSIVTSQIYRDLAEKPIPFKLTFDSSLIDPAATYTVQAMIVDDQNSWASAHGTPVLTKGNPSDVDITLAYRPDLVKGTVTGQVAGLGLKPSADAYSVAILVDRTSGETLGIDSTNAPKGLPVPFGVPFALNDVTPGSDYVVTAEVVNGDETWRNTEGVPVITNGNSRSGIQVVVAEVVAPSPSAARSAPPNPPAAPISVEDSNSGGLLGIIILVALIGALAAFLIARGRGDTDAAAPADAPAATATETDETVGTPPTTPPTGPTPPAA
jgi:uncharacterized lipoprotein YbaY